jgi:hypothetical protein
MNYSLQFVYSSVYICCYLHIIYVHCIIYIFIRVYTSVPKPAAAAELPSFVTPVLLHTAAASPPSVPRIPEPHTASKHQQQNHKVLNQESSEGNQKRTTKCQPRGEKRNHKVINQESSEGNQKRTTKRQPRGEKIISKTAHYMNQLRPEFQGVNFVRETSGERLAELIFQDYLLAGSHRKFPKQASVDFRG